MRGAFQRSAKRANIDYNMPTIPKDILANMDDITVYFNCALFYAGVR